MTDATVIQLIVTTGGLGVLGLFTIWAMQGKVRWEKGVLEQHALYEKRITDLQERCTALEREHAAEVARLEARNDKLWESLQHSVATAREAVAVTRQAAAVTETVVKGGT